MTNTLCTKSAHFTTECHVIQVPRQRLSCSKPFWQPVCRVGSLCQEQRGERRGLSARKAAKRRLSSSSKKPASTMSKHIGIPIKVLHDAEGHTVTVELKTGEVFRGKLDEAEDNMNVHLSNCTKTAKDGRVSTLSKYVHRLGPFAA